MGIDLARTRTFSAFRHPNFRRYWWGGGGGRGAALAALTWFHLVRVWHIYLLSFVNGVTMAADSPARQALVPRLVAREDLTNAIALNALVFNGSRIIGPPIGGLVHAEGGSAGGRRTNAPMFLALV